MSISCTSLKHVTREVRKLPARNISLHFTSTRPLTWRCQSLHISHKLQHKTFSCIFSGPTTTTKPPRRTPYQQSISNHNVELDFFRQVRCNPCLGLHLFHARSHIRLPYLESQSQLRRDTSSHELGRRYLHDSHHRSLLLCLHLGRCRSRARRAVLQFYYLHLQMPVRLVISDNSLQDQQDTCGRGLPSLPGDTHDPSRSQLPTHLLLGMRRIIDQA